MVEPSLCRLRSFREQYKEKTRVRDDCEQNAAEQRVRTCVRLRSCTCLAAPVSTLWPWCCNADSRRHACAAGIGVTDLFQACPAATVSACQRDVSKPSASQAIGFRRSAMITWVDADISQWFVRHKRDRVMPKARDLSHQIRIGSAHA